MEMSEAAGMRRLSESERDAIRATTFGVGEMIFDATKRGANEIIIGLGGSAPNDGGFGMARALGFQFFGEGANEIESFDELPLLNRIERTKELKRPRIVAAVDVKNPLLGENGATPVFGPQKGASKSDVDNLERALTRLADVVATEFGFDHRNEAGAGAAGGLGFGLLSFCVATIRPGFESVAEAVELEPNVKHADLVMTR